MKKLQLFSLLLLFGNILSAQEYTKIDTVLQEFYYNYKFQPDSTNAEWQKSQEMILQIGKNYSKFIPVNKVAQDSLIYTLRNVPIKKIAEIMYKDPILSAPVSSFCNYRLFKNYPQKEEFELWGNIGIEFYLTDKGKLQFNWKLNTAKDTTILGYKCHKATCHFAGRDYTAWYTPDIPISNGPYKFTGLPGLILSIADTKKQHRFDIYKIKTNVRRDMVFYGKRSKYRYVTSPQYVKAVNRAFISIAKKYGGLNSVVKFKDEAERAKFNYKVRSNNNYIEKYP